MEIRSRTVSETAAACVRLAYYPPAFRMPAHAHDHDQSSIVLAGDFVESTNSRSAELRPGATGFKAAGLHHEDVYGPQGALILSVNTRAGRSTPSRWRWRLTAESARTRQLAALLFEQPSSHDDVLTDLAATADGDPWNTGDAAPAWLNHARAAIDDDPAEARAATLAAAAGVSRVHLSRRFIAAFGEPLSLYRRRAMIAKGLRALINDRLAPGAAAADAGFADQAHFTRALRLETGMTPARLAALMRRAS